MEGARPEGVRCTIFKTAKPRHQARTDFRASNELIGRKGVVVPHLHLQWEGSSAPQYPTQNCPNVDTNVRCKPSQEHNDRSHVKRVRLTSTLTLPTWRELTPGRDVRNSKPATQRCRRRMNMRCCCNQVEVGIRKLLCNPSPSTNRALIERCKPSACTSIRCTNTTTTLYSNASTAHEQSSVDGINSANPRSEPVATDPPR